MSQSKRLLITGADGFTGRYVWDAAIAAGYEPLAPLAGFDLLSPESCQATIEHTQPDYLIHLAALSFVAHPDQSALYSVNTVGTQNLLQAVHNSGLSLKKIIIASSANVYGNVPVEQQPITERQPPAPVNHYAASKLAMEYMVHTWFDKLPITITRPFNYTGVGQADHFLVPKLVKHFAERLPTVSLGNLDVARDYSDVRDVAADYVFLLQQPLAGETINLCTGRAQSLSSILETLRKLSGHSIAVLSDQNLQRVNEISSIRGSSLAWNLEKSGDGCRREFSETLAWMMNTATPQS
jgi:GDP-6-deoxy-D-talose 4-dehydrogenase